ncbi:MAG: YqaE/Pmp3 family membrane protein [Cyclobacteriaceae bacterium]|nr:YqaE/Pmp3 family membrane protein [Cyclobacteriaceae bacterium]
MKILNKIITFGVIVTIGCAPKHSAHFTHSNFQYPFSEKGETVITAVNAPNDTKHIALEESMPMDENVPVKQMLEGVSTEKSKPDTNTIKSESENLLHSDHEIANHFTGFSKEERIKISKEDKKNLRKELKSTLRKSFEEDAGSTDPVLLIILCFLLPPLAVYLVYDVGTEFWISLILTLLGWLPGVIYSLIVVLA